MEEINHTSLLSGNTGTEDQAALLKTILDTIPEMIVYHDDDLNIVWANKAAAAFVGLTREEFIGQRFFDVACQRSQPEPCENCPVLTGVASECQEVIGNPLQLGRLYFTRSYRFPCADQKTQGRLVVCQDISNLRTQFSVTDVLNLLSEIFQLPDDLSGICQKLVEEIVRRFDYPVGYITLYQETTGELVNVGEVNLSGKTFSLTKRYPAADFFAWKSIKEGHVTNVTVLSSIKDTATSVLRDFGAETTLAVPLPVEGKITGAIVLIDFVERLETNLMIDGLLAIANRLGAEIRRKQTEEKLREERNFSNAVLNHAAPLIVIFDHAGIVVRFNKACEKITGYTHEEARGTPIWKYLEGIQDSDFIKKVFPLKGEHSLPPSFEGYVISKTGDKRLVSWSNNTVGDTKRHGFHIVSVGIDITDRKIAEEEAELRKQQLLKADKMASLGVLASGIAHEINNPNNFIMMNAPIFRAVWNGVTPILDKYYDEYGDFTVANMRYTQMRGELPKLFDGIENGSERIRRIIKNMKNYSVKDRPTLRQPVNMNEVVAAAVSLLAHEIKKSTKDMVLRCSENLPFVHGSIHRLEQVMVNIIQNACQSIVDREKSITIETSFDKKNDEVVVDVLDEGIGIRPQHMGHITDPFFTTKSDVGGTGLGLSICTNIVKEHNGRLEFTSVLEKGTSVRLSLPVMR